MASQAMCMVSESRPGFWSTDIGFKAGASGHLWALIILFLVEFYTRGDASARRPVLIATSGLRGSALRRKLTGSREEEGLRIPQRLISPLVELVLD